MKAPKLIKVKPLEDKMESPKIKKIIPVGCGLLANIRCVVDCSAIKCDDCPINNGAKPSELETWLRLQLCDPGDSDLSKVKVGDWIYTIAHGWEKVIAAGGGNGYPIKTETESYTTSGKRVSGNTHPSAWVRPPAYLNAPPKPEFKNGDRVLVRNNENENWKRRYFNVYKAGTPVPYKCFIEGRDEWTSEGSIVGWKYCKPWKEE